MYSGRIHIHRSLNFRLLVRFLCPDRLAILTLRVRLDRLIASLSNTLKNLLEIRFGILLQLDCQELILGIESDALPFLLRVDKVEFAKTLAQSIGTEGTDNPIHLDDEFISSNDLGNRFGL